MSRTMYPATGYGEAPIRKTQSGLAAQRKAAASSSAALEMEKGQLKLAVRLTKILDRNDRVHGFDQPTRADAGRYTIKSLQAETRSVKRLANGMAEYADTELPDHAKEDGHPQKSTGSLLGLGYTKSPAIASAANLGAVRRAKLLQENSDSCQANVGHHQDGVDRLLSREQARTVYFNDMTKQKLAAKGLKYANTQAQIKEKRRQEIVEN